MKTRPDVLWKTIYDKLIQHVEGYEVDIRYLNRWIKAYPNYFPTFVINGNYEPVFNWNKMRWEIYRIKI